MQGWRSAYNIGGGHGKLKKYDQPPCCCFFFCVQCLIFPVLCKEVWEHGTLTLTNFLYFRKLKPQKHFFYFLKKNVFLIFRETETPKKFFIFQEKDLFYISGNGFFLYFEKRYIRNPDIFRTRSICRTLVYLELETYSESCQIPTMEHFAKNSYLVQFLIFTEMKFSSFIFLLFFRK